MGPRHVSYYICKVLDCFEAAAQEGEKQDMTVPFGRTPLQEAAIREQLRAGYVITADKPSKVEMRQGGNVIVVLQDGSVRRGVSEYQRVGRRSSRNG